MRPSLATDPISLGFWLNISFVVNYQWAAMVFTIPTTFGITHAWCYTRAERAAQSATWLGSALLNFLTVPSTHYVPKIVFTFSQICRACTNSISIHLIITRDFIFLCIGPHQQSTISSELAVIAGDGVRRYFDPHDILTPGSNYRNDILTPLTIFWPPIQ